jgi:hypothetical protein
LAEGATNDDEKEEDMVIFRVMPEGGAMVETGMGTELGEVPEALTALILYLYSVLEVRLLMISDVPSGTALSA